MRDYWVDVCDECYRACCWHGEDMCEEARYAGIIKKKASELRKLKLEHSSYFAKETLDRVCGGFDWVE